jgi:hypothetical protein
MRDASESTKATAGNIGPREPALSPAIFGPQVHLAFWIYGWYPKWGPDPFTFKRQCGQARWSLQRRDRAPPR